MRPRSTQAPYQILDPAFPPHYLHARTHITGQDYVPYYDFGPPPPPPLPDRGNFASRHGRNWPRTRPGQRPLQLPPMAPGQNRFPPRAPGHHVRASGPAIWRTPPLFINPTPGGNNALMENAQMEQGVYQDLHVNTLQNADNAHRTRLINMQTPFPVDNRINARQLHRIPENFSSNPSTDELENIYAMRYLADEVPPAPPPPRQLTRVPFDIINHRPFQRHNHHDDMQMMINNRAFYHQNFLRNLSAASSSIFWRRNSESTNYCYGCNMRLVVFITSIIVGIGIALLLASLYIAGML